uniref:Uncharacterized protein n=1 Tax=Candidatus Kentrum sp. TUN TaxID=2126343 RepID=A0A451AME2_9GAMM|nr:MAG: hypothetical protein BECKTUN1418F_GA0071002_11374 [Candidatus Kentron sp. TUN]VFK67177.1 MAG: hypothetical protein BECKTUN1418E_GA0071001_11363 [Candidatus Kentron sp. TUN]
MSTSLLYHTWGIRGYTYIHTRYERGKTIFRIEQDAATLRSSCCGSEKIRFIRLKRTWSDEETEDMRANIFASSEKFVGRYFT